MTQKKFLTSLIAGLTMSLTAVSAHAGNVLDKVMKAGTITVATDANWAPQSFINDDNQLDGFDVDVAKAIAKHMGVKIEFVTPAWDIITAGNWAGRWDMHVGSMTPTIKRGEVFTFPGVYYYTPAAVAVHNDSKATSLKDLDGKVVAATTTSTYELYLKKDLTIDAEGVPAFEYQVNAGEIRSLDNINTSLDDLRLGDGVRLSAVVGSLPSFLEAQKNGYPIKVLGDPIFYEPLSVAIENGDADLAKKIADAVASMKADGTLATLSKKWYGVDYSSTK